MAGVIPSYSPQIGLLTPLEEFRDLISTKFKVQLRTYDDLHAFSVTRLNDFWMTVWEFAGVKASRQPVMALDETIPIDQFPRFFEGAKLNFAENMLSRQGDGVAIVDMNEANMLDPTKYSWNDLRELVRSYACALKASGLEKGDVLALVAGNCVRSLALLLATAALGGIFASFATDMGSKALADRVQLLSPRFVFAESVYTYNGKQHSISSKIDALLVGLERSNRAPREVVIFGPSETLESQCTTLDSFLARDDGSESRFEQMPFETPLVVMFSSGTTGLPKGIVHSHGGLVMNGMKEYLFHNNLGPEDVHYQFTNIGWTLWNIAIGGLFVGASIILYDGSPFFPTPDKFLSLLFKQRITCFGAGPRYYSELQKLNVKPKKYAGHLHSIISTGAVLTPSLASWLADAFGPVCQISMSGGTELCGAFLHGTRSLPSYPGEIAAKALGMDIAVFSADGKPLVDGESGELVCRKPFPNMPVMFWNDPERKRYFASYFEEFPHVWTHGDFVQVNPVTKGFYVLGRSDGVLNPSGVRFGSSEIYNILSTQRFSDRIIDSIVVGQQRISEKYTDTTERVVLFIKCTSQSSSNSLRPRADLEAAIRQQIERDLSRRHVPSFIFECSEVPYNANGKKLEIPVKAVLCGGTVAMSKLKVTKEELVQIKWYAKFFDMEQAVAASQNGNAKL